jgi:hypothetical protein
MVETTERLYPKESLKPLESFKDNNNIRAFMKVGENKIFCEWTDYMNETGLLQKMSQSLIKSRILLKKDLEEQ